MCLNRSEKWKEEEEVYDVGSIDLIYAV